MATQGQLAGQVISHYRIIEKIGGGGMGVVYRARDEQLERDVAIKVLPAGILADDTARKRFRKEALALAKLNHPNIATIYEFGSQDGIDFLVTEYIPGTTLDEKLRGGSLTPKESIALGSQITQGLAAAHEQGVVHRDLKPGNLRITPDGRLKILDFGLAQLMPQGGNADLAVTLTQSQQVVGTLPYMAPEQLRGEPCDARTDIWAVGAVLYETCTGQRPFPERSSPALIDCILNQPPQPPSSLNRKLPAGLEFIILKALEKGPAHRYQSSRELSVDLERLAAGQLPATPARKRPSLSMLFPAFLLLIAVSASGWFWFSHRKKPSLPEAAHDTARITSAATRRSVAVLGFKNLSGRPEEDWLSTALSEMLSTELAAGEQVRTIPGESVATMKINLSLADADSYGTGTLSKIRANLNADDVVVGSYLPLGKGQIRLDLRLQDAIRGETLASVSVKGSEDQIDLLVTRAGSTLREKLGAGAVSESEAAAIRATLPSNSDAARYYSEGLAKLQTRDALAARSLLEKAVAAEPKFALAHAALADAWKTLGYDPKAAGEAKTAFDLSTGLGREDKLSIEGRYREMTADWNRAIEVYRTLWQFSPDNLEYGLRLAMVQDRASKFAEALDTLQQLRRLPPPQSDDPRVDLEETNADIYLSKWKEGIDASARAISKSKASGARLILALALQLQGACFRYLGESSKSEASFKQAKDIYAAAGEQFGVARATTDLGIAAYHRGDLKTATELYEQALATERAVGAEGAAAQTLQNIAIAFYDQGDLARSTEMYRSALATARKLDNRDLVASCLNSLGNVLADEGDHAGAQKAYREALEDFEKSGNRSNAAMTMGNLGTLLADEGNLREAKSMFEKALEIKRGLNNRHSEAYTYSNLGDLLLTEGDLAGARKMQEEALAIRRELGEKSTANENQFSLASIALEEGKPADALVAAQQVAEAFSAERRPDHAATAHDLAARCLLALGKPEAADGEMQKAEKFSATTSDKIIATALAITRARVLTASGDFPASRRKLDAALAAATKSGLPLWQLETRLAIAELELKSGNVHAARTHLGSVEKDAAAKGFLLVASKAHRLRSSQGEQN